MSGYTGARSEYEHYPIQAVVRLVTELSKPISTLLRKRGLAAYAAANTLAALGALYDNKGNLHVGSRLTIYEREARTAENLWQKLQMPLLLFSTIWGAEPILAGMLKALTHEAQSTEASKWTGRDFKKLCDSLSDHCVCTTGDDGLTAEFALGNGAGSAIAGDLNTALFQVMAGEPHLELGGGILLLLQMPHEARDEAQLQKICQKLNVMEMAAADLPAHFGAWCPGKAGNNPAYVSFLPNKLYGATQFTSNMAFWAMARARWANGALKKLGLRM